MEKLNLVKRVNLVSRGKEAEEFIAENYDIFNGTGMFDKECKIEVNKDEELVANPPRRNPLTVRDKLKETLKKLEKKEIISKVENPRGWVSNLVIIEKKYKNIRICLDPKPLNEAIKRPKNMLIPTLDKITERMSNKEYFTVLDLKEGFWHVKLNEESGKLCMFSTPFGCYKFNRLPFGLNMAPGYFQKINNDNFGDIEGLTVYFDDLLIAAETEEKHDMMLEKVIN